MPPLDVSQSEQWAAVCYNKLSAVDLRTATRKAKRPQSDLMMAHAFDKAPAFRALEPTLADHSGLSSTLLSITAGRTLLRQAIDLDALTFPEPADNSIGRQTDARCVICKNVKNDAWHATDTGIVCHGCLACRCHVWCGCSDIPARLLEGIVASKDRSFFLEFFPEVFLASTVGPGMAWRCAGDARCGRVAVGPEPDGLDSWVGRLVGRRASDLLEGCWNRCDPVAQAVGC